VIVLARRQRLARRLRRHLTPIANEALAKATSPFVARDLKALARIAMRSARTPVASALLARRVTRRACEPFFFLRVPQLAARKPFQHRIGMSRLQLLQRRQQFLFRAGAKRGWLALENDRPVRVAWRHWAWLRAVDAVRAA
jgi:hypothetical protein